MQKNVTQIGLLPAPTILEKLKAVSPIAPEYVMLRAEVLQQQHFAEQERAFLQKQKHQTLRSIFRAFAPRRKIELPAPEENSVQKSWENIGHHMRQAMRDYIEENNINVAALNLTENEKNDLFAYRAPQARPYKNNFSG